MIETTRAAIKTPTSGELSYVIGGDGASLVLLHRSIGGDSLSGLVSALVPSFSVIAPSMPGYDDSDRPGWARSPRDLAAILLDALHPLASERAALVGLGLGGWVAAEMAAMSPERFRALVLVSPLGVQPTVGEITDPFLVSTDRYVEMGFANHDEYEQVFHEYGVGTDVWVRRERNREMTTRIAWRPRMFDATLPYRLAYVTMPTMILRGEDDRILPPGGVDRYAASMPRAELVTLPGCGHLLECEAPAKVGELISLFLAA